MPTKGLGTPCAGMNDFLENMSEACSPISSIDKSLSLAVKEVCNASRNAARRGGKNDLIGKSRRLLKQATKSLFVVCLYPSTSCS